MSVSHPLITALKGSTRELLLWTQGSDTRRDVDDACATLVSLCADLEEILQRGLLPRRSLWGSQPPEAWNWIEEVADRPSSPYGFQTAVALARKSAKVNTARGRLRVAIRACLSQGCLHVPVQALLQSGEQRSLYRAGAVLGDAILAEILVSVLLQLSRLPFKLALFNARFLDYTWQLPIAARIELLPCAAVGLSLDFVGDLPIVAAIAPGSIAADTELIDVGDVLDEINGVVISDKTRGSLKNIMRRGANMPVTITVVKLLLGDGEVYAPLNAVIAGSRIAPVVDRAMRDRRRDPPSTATDNLRDRTATCPKLGLESARKRIRHGLPACYEGVASTGRVGDIRCIEAGLEEVARAQCDASRRRVTFECQEVGVRVVDVDSNKVVVSHTYMEISACGRSPRWPGRFAYIAGDDNPNCSLATSFSCYVFSAHALDARDVEDLLRSIAQGFARTNFAV